MWQEWLGGERLEHEYIVPKFSNYFKKSIITISSDENFHRKRKCKVVLLWIEDSTVSRLLQRGSLEAFSYTTTALGTLLMDPLNF